MLEKRPDETLIAADSPDALEQKISDVKSAIISKMTLAVGKDPAFATDRDWFLACALTARDRATARFLEGKRNNASDSKKRVYYLSLEFLIGRQLTDVLSNLGLLDVFRQALGDLGVDYERVRATEPDAALGNGGLGRLAACFMESMATLGIPAYGYGIRYDHGLFQQVIQDGWQQEVPEYWLSFGSPWEFLRTDVIYDIKFGGSVETKLTDKGVTRYIWHPAEIVHAVSYDTPIVGWRGENVNPLRLWSARAVDPLRLELFNQGDYVGAASDQARAEAISKVLYPSDETASGQELRLRQEYFFVSASLQDLVNRHLRIYGDLHSLPERAAIQLNDTHPAVAIAEMMRLLLDEHGLPWNDAWAITAGTFSYTNHTLLPEALETWPLPLFERLLPRHLQIIYFINNLHLEAAKAAFPGEPDLLTSVSIIDERDGRKVRMGQLAFVGSHTINGVSALHTDLMRKTTFRDLNRIYPDRIQNKTNGVTFRRWLHQSNPGLTAILREVCGDEVLDNPERIVQLADHAEDSALQRRVQAVKRSNKTALAKLILERTGVRVEPGALFDVQIKRIHEYKRQLLNLLETVALYHAMRANPSAGWTPRVKIIAGKAAASYVSAKLIIKLANDIAKTVNSDPAVQDLLKVVFLPNYNVSLAETIIPAADLSEQISTAGMEASGTGNMKLALNGALTIGTLDGANIEIRDNVGDDNIFIFGLTTEEVSHRRERGISAASAIAASPALGQVLDAISDGEFSPDDRGRFGHLMEGLRNNDRYMLTDDFDSYYAAQRRVDTCWQTPERWTRSAIINIANMAWFSSDRTIREYANDIWHVSLPAAN
ncbi:glycogen/starch/alpha-glucan phosphorylase [Terrihabitans sp. B22-R8]|uniref:glycogen/starch/alpha-glucan phosphorylase n=1 Tax=Terrihabitans sp. B22-R8 TaxID=3425128 RepID=UPI00403C95FC